MSVTSPDPTPNAAPTPVIRRARAAEASIISAMAVWSLMACHLLTDRLSGAHPDTLPRLAEAVGLAEAVALFGDAPCDQEGVRHDLGICDRRANGAVDGLAAARDLPDGAELQQPFGVEEVQIAPAGDSGLMREPFRDRADRRHLARARLPAFDHRDRKSTRLNSSHANISYA